MKVKKKTTNKHFNHKRCNGFKALSINLLFGYFCLFLLPILGSKYCLRMEKEAQTHLKTMETVKRFLKPLLIKFPKFGEIHLFGLIRHMNWSVMTSQR